VFYYPEEGEKQIVYSCLSGFGEVPLGNECSSPDECCPDGCCSGNCGGTKSCTNGKTRLCFTSAGCEGIETCVNKVWGSCVDNNPNDDCPSSVIDCTNDATQPCTTSDNCSGIRICTNKVWGSCVDNNPNDNCPSSVSGCTNGATRDCTTSAGCVGTETCINKVWGGSCVDNDPNDNCPDSSSSTCKIISFTINGKCNIDKYCQQQDPLIVWVNASLTGYFSVSDTCKTCTVASSINGGWNEDYEISKLRSSITTDPPFKITTAGTYTYTLTCEDADGIEVQDTLSLETVKALNLPWWREIIPNLTGFLRGIIR
jgi:hypothetical protein